MEIKFKGHANKGGIYKITNVETGKVYIGSTGRFKKRAYDHQRFLKKGTSHNKYLQASYNKWGEGAFLFEVVEVVDGDKFSRTAKEQEYLENYFETWDQCYNFLKRTIQKQGPWSIDPAKTKKKLSKIRKNKTYEEIFGKENAKIIRENQSKAHKKNWTPQRRAEYGKKYSGRNNPFFGKKHTRATKEKLSNAQAGISLEQRVGKEKAEKIKNALRMSGRKRMKDINMRRQLGDRIRGKTFEEIYGPARSEEIKKKRSRGIAKTKTGFCLVDPSGGKYTKITNLRQFCIKHNLINSCMHRLLAGKLKSHKGWKIV